MPHIADRDEITRLDDPTTRLLHAGARLLRDAGFQVVAAGLSPERVAAIAGRTRRTFYDHFETKEEFVRSVFGAFLAIEDHTILGAVFREAFEDTVLAAEGDFVESIAAMSHMLFDLTMGSDELYLHALAVVLSRTDPTVHETLASYTRSADGLYVDAITEGLDAWGFRMRAPWTPHMTSVVIRSLADGFYTRDALDPGSIDEERFTLVLLTLFATILQPETEPPETVLDLLSTLQRRSTIEWKVRQDPTLAINARRQVLDTLHDELRRRPLSELTLDGVAITAGVAPDTVTQIFGTIDEMVDQAVRATLPPLAREADFDLRAASVDHRAVLRRHLDRMGTWATDHPHLARAVAASFGQANPLAVRLVAEMSAPVLAILGRAASDSHAVDADHAAWTATMTTQLLLTHIAHRTAEADPILDWIVGLALRLPAPADHSGTPT